MRTLKLSVLPITLALTFGLSGCRSSQPATQAPIVDGNNAAITGPDPALANLAPVDPNAAQQPGYATQTAAQPKPIARVLGQRQDYPQTAPTSEQYPENDQAYDAYDQQVNAGQDALYADQAPPPLPVYDQPELTQANDQWTPGYWNYANSGYFFVPGAWIAPPYSGALWTPGYWGYQGSRYRFHRGFWGRHIGFYGGINYGFGYYGRGYEGGYWNNNRFYYNDRINRVNVAVVHDVYQRNVVIENNNHYSYNGPGGYQARPVAAELAVYHEQRLPPQRAQLQIREQASTNRQQFFAENHGRPAVAAAPQRFNADAQQARPIQPAQRNGFGQQGVNTQQQRQVQQQQAQQQRNVQQQQHTAQQQQNVQRQQQEAQRTQQLQQRNVQQQQQRAQQLQQRNTQSQTAEQQQHVLAQQQHNVQAQQQNVERQQHVQAQQQHTQQNEQVQQQRAQQEQQRGQQQQQRVQQQQQRTQPEQQRAEPQQPRTQQVQQRPQPAAQPAPRPAPAAQPAPRPAPAPAPRPAPAAPPEHHGGERPHR